VQSQFKMYRSVSYCCFNMFQWCHFVTMTLHLCYKPDALTSLMTSQCYTVTLSLWHVTSLCNRVTSLYSDCQLFCAFYYINWCFLTINVKQLRISVSLLLSFSSQCQVLWWFLVMSTQPGHPSVSRYSEYKWSWECTCSISVVWQSKLVSGSELKKGRSALWRTLFFYFLLDGNLQFRCVANVNEL